MIYNYIKLELTFCILLIMLLIFEYSVELWMDNEIYNSNNNQAISYQAVLLPSLVIDNPVFKDDSQIHDRPLFNEDRKPQKIAATTTDSTAPDVGGLDNWLLIGVFNKDHTMSALFRNRTENKKYLKITENQTIAGWLIKEIKPTHVLLELSGQERLLELVTIKPKANKPSADYDPALKR